MSTFKHAVIAVTYKCNSRCRMCNIWKIDSHSDLPPSAFRNLPEKIEEVNITGGEPFLRDDLVEIIDVIHERSYPDKIVIPTNAFLTDRVLRICKQIMDKPYRDKVTIAVSIDGIGNVHDEIRGIPGGFDMAMATVKGLQGMGFPNIGFGFTFMAGNEDEYEKVYQLTLDLGINFGVSIAHNSDNYFSTAENKPIDTGKLEAALEKTISDKIGSMRKNELGKCYYFHGMIEFAKKKEMILPCNALHGSFFIDPAGNLYPCNILTDSIGNIKEQELFAIWNSEAADEARKKVAHCPEKCWMVCTAKPAIKKHWIRAGMWIMREKFKKLFRI